MRTVLIVARYNALMVLRNKRAAGMSLLFPLVLLLFWGYIGKNASVQAGFGDAARVSLTGFLMVGMIVLTTMSTGIMGYSINMAHLREQGALRRVRCTPLPAWQFFAGRMAAQLAINALATVAMVAAGMAVFGVQLTWSTAPLGAGVILLAILLFTGMGQLIASVVVKPETVQATAQLIYFPLMFLSGLFVQPAIFPQGLQDVARWLPGAVAVGLARAALLQGSMGAHPVLELSVLLGYVVAVLVAASKLFKWL
jgi:ABC-2 type transport system permease protein